MTLTNEVPRVGVVGCGYWGKNLVRNFYELGALHAVCDVDESRRKELSKKYAVTAVQRIEELLRMEPIKAIVIAAPAAQHFELSKSALLAGKDVFVEKPLALRVEEGEELVDLARRHDRILMVGHLLQYHPAINELKRLVVAGELGRIQYIYSSRLNLGKLRTEENILWSFAPHDISVILFMLGELPSQVAAHSGSYLNPRIADVTVTTFDFSSGVKAHIFVSWLHPFKEQKLVIAGDRKMAVFDGTETHRQLVIYPHRIDWVDRVPVAHKAEGEVLALGSEEPLRLECQHFLECLSARSNPRTDGEEGLRVLRVLQACESSMQNQGEPWREKAQELSYFAHPTAVIDEPCEIGKGTKIWHFSHIMAGSKLGRNCNLGQNVVVSPGCRVGNNVKIQNNVSVYTGVELEDDVFCGPSMVFTNVINPRSHIDRKREYQRTIVKRGASLGANSTIVCGVTIGQFAFVGAGAVVTHDVPQYALVVGVPAELVGWMCSCGTRLIESESLTECPKCGSRFCIENGTCSEMSTAMRTSG